MTYLHKPVRRETYARIPLHTKTDRLIVTLYPGSLIGFREKGRRKEYCLDIGALYLRAIVAEINAAKKERRRMR